MNTANMQDVYKRKEKNTMVDIYISTKHTGKTAGLLSFSTSCKDNERCRKNAQIPGSVCAKCYANRYLSYRKTLREAVGKNEILKEKLFEINDFPIVNAAYFRIEVFGDVENVTQARNYLRFIKRNPQTFFGWWTKNCDILAKAIAKEGKPGNVKIIRSSLFLNKPARNKYDFVDAVFTVYDKKTIAEKEVDINCGGRSCMTCGRCYRKGGEFYINEQVK